MADLKNVLEAFNNVASIVKTLAETPGVNMLPYASTISSAIGVLQTAYAAGNNIAPYVLALKDTFSGGVPTQEQLDALDAKIADLRGQLHAPLPDQEAGEPE
jgi:hypothetical protein